MQKNCVDLGMNMRTVPKWVPMFRSTVNPCTKTRGQLKLIQFAAGFTQLETAPDRDESVEIIDGSRRMKSVCLFLCRGGENSRNYHRGNRGSLKWHSFHWPPLQLIQEKKLIGQESHGDTSCSPSHCEVVGINFYHYLTKYGNLAQAVSCPEGCS